MLRAKAARARAEGRDAAGRAGSATWTRWAPSARATAPLTQLGERASRPHRALLEAVVGIDRDPQSAEVPPQDLRALVPGARRRPRARADRKVALFFSCSVNYNEPQVGRDAVSVLEKNGCAVSCPEQVCCGMPYLDGGDIEAATANARSERRGAASPRGGGRDRGRAPAHLLLRAQEGVPDARARARPRRRWRRRRGTSSSTWPAASRRARSTRTSRARRRASVAYQMPCHLRAQNMGYKTRDVLQLIPGTPR